MNEQCPLNYIKQIICSGPIDMGKNRYVCPKSDGECQRRLNARLFETNKSIRLEIPEDQTFNFNYREP